MRELRVLHVLPDLAVGGGQVIVRNLVAADVAGIRHHVATLGDGPMAAAFADAGAPPWRVGARSARDLAGAARRLATHIRRAGIDVVHTNNTPADRIVGAAAARATGRPTVNTLMAIATSHRARQAGEAPAAFVRRRAGNVANRVLARAATDRMVALSDTVRRSHAAALGLPPARIDVIHPGLPLTAPPDPARVAATARALGVEDAYPVLLSVGRVEPNKGQRDLVPVLARLVTWHPSARLLVAGDGEDRPALLDDLARAGLGDHAAVLGRRDDVAVLAELSDIFVSTSHHEGFGMAALEAMAGGCAVAAYTNDWVAVGEFVTDGVTGRLVAEEPAALADAILDLAADHAALAAAGRAARRTAERLSAACSAQRYAHIYRQLARSRGGCRRSPAREPEC